MTFRSQPEIVDRFRAIDAAGTDWMGFRLDVLAESMTRDSLATVGIDMPVAAELLPTVPAGNVERAAHDYLAFAVGKAVAHRGLSAGRSVDKLREYAWLLGRDDVVAAMESAEYPQYGVPKLKAFAGGMGWPWPGDVDAWDVKALVRMAEGLPCQDDCVEGCDQ